MQQTSIQPANTPRKKPRQWIWVIVILAVAVAATIGLSMARKAPEKKTEPRLPPLVSLQPFNFTDIVYQVGSQGSMQAKTETTLVSEVNGKITAIAEAFVAGGFFQAGDVLVRIEPADYQTSVKAAEAALATAKAALEEERARAKVAERDWLNFTSGKAPALGLRKPQLASALAKVNSAEADLERARRDLSRTEIRAPYSGMVKSRAANLGQFVSRGSQLGVLVDTSIAEIRLPLTLADLADLGVADQTKFALPVTLSDDSGQQWPATLVRTEGVLDSQSRVLHAIAELTDPYRREQTGTPLRFGQFVQAKITGRTASAVMQLPRHLLKPGQQVVVADKDLKLQLRQVRLDRADQAYAYIAGGSEDGDQLVISPLANPIPGMQVRTETAATTTAQGATQP
jgi:RND family efflux transporter MFP subunit